MQFVARALGQVVAALGFATAPAAFAQSAEPTQGGKPITLIVGFAPGGSADSIARVVGGPLGEKLGRRIVVENRPGAGANIAARAVVQSPPDGNTLLVTTAALPINETLYKNKGFVASTLMPISIVATTPEVFAINKDAKAQDLAGFIKESAGQEVIFATAGIGTSSHIAGEYFFRFIVKTSAKHVPFRGGPDATNAVLGGHVPMVVSSLSGFPSQVAGGALRALAIADTKRNDIIKQVPTFADAGYPGFTAYSWVGFFAPKGSSAQFVADLNKHIDAIAQDPAVQQRLRTIGFDPMGGDVKSAEAFMAREYAQWKTMVESLNLSVE
ncbi:MAG: tripartite tricarboxylate transporter substrate binding protein [Beijerinckiaceae bacterium]|nr:tripartite tricarboxylate transporter substrate binding protein [Beijerinckiaceae bacterium]